jgi:hypothetical protein
MLVDELSEQEADDALSYLENRCKDLVAAPADARAGEQAAEADGRPPADAAADRVAWMRKICYAEIRRQHGIS